MSDIDPVRLIAAHREAIGFYHQNLLGSDVARLYLARRGFAVLALRDLPWNAAVEKPWHVGYAPPGWRHLTDHLTQLGYAFDELVAAGLARRAESGRVYDTFRDRIMFPIRDASGDPIAFTGRTLKANERKPKYLNTPNTSIFHKGQTLYGTAEQADRLAEGAAPVLVEGPFDVIAIWLAHTREAGLPRAALAACGTNLSPAHVAALAAMPGAARHGITACYDSDRAGTAATNHAWQLLHRCRDIPLRAAALPNGYDPADLADSPGGLAALREALSYRARPLLEAVIDHRLDAFIDRHADRHDSAELRVAAVRTVAGLLTHIPPDDIHRVVAHVAEATATSVEAVISAVIAEFEREDGTPDASPLRPPTAAAFPPSPTPVTNPSRWAMAGHPASHTPTLRSPRRNGRR